jgi:hypothetical protein
VNGNVIPVEEIGKERPRSKLRMNIEFFKYLRTTVVFPVDSVRSTKVNCGSLALYDRGTVGEDFVGATLLAELGLGVVVIKRSF